MIHPTVGRTVWFWPPAVGFTHVAGGDQPLVAFITHVHSDTLINVAGFDAVGTHFKLTSVPLHQEGDARPDGFFAEWMPYQIGQAKAFALRTDGALSDAQLRDLIPPAADEAES